MKSTHVLYLKIQQYFDYECFLLEGDNQHNHHPNLNEKKQSNQPKTKYKKSESKVCKSAIVNYFYSIVSILQYY